MIFSISCGSGSGGADNGNGDSDEDGNTNSAPQLTGIPQTSVTAGSVYSFIPQASDPDGDVLIFEVFNKPSWASFSSSTGELRGTPSTGDTGTYNGVIITVRDASDAAVLPPFSVSVYYDNSPPDITGTPQTSATAGSSYSFSPSATDPDGDSLSYEIVNKPLWASFSALTGILSGTPQTEHTGVYNGIIIKVTDNKGGSDYLSSFSVTVYAVNTPPQINGTPIMAITSGTAYAFAPSVSDADGDTLTYNILNKPSWAAFDNSTGVLTGTAVAGVYGGIVITVSDGKGGMSALPAFGITVYAVNTPPQINGTPLASLTSGTAYAFVPSVSDADGDTLTCNILNKPSWAAFDNSTGVLTGTAVAGVYGGIVITVSDGKGGMSALPAFGITVYAVNTPPQINGTPLASLTSGTAYAFVPSVSDADGDTLTCNILNKPSWAAFDNSTGVLTGTAVAGVYGGIVITVSDGKGGMSALPAFGITVYAVNTPPQINGTPLASLTSGTAYAFVPSVSDADGDTLTYNILNKPSWAAFDNSTGVLTGTAVAGVYGGIVITVSDGKGGMSALPAFGITVYAVNTPPQISGTPDTSVHPGYVYLFEPVGNDPDGDIVIYSIENMPSWADFSRYFGILTGTPSARDVGTYADIVISISDGISTVLLAPFTVNVAFPPLGVLKTGQTVSYMNYDDGFYQKGITRSYSRTDEIVTDTVTGLHWQDNADVETVQRDWQGAIDYCDALELGDYDDWRLPVGKELMSIVDHTRNVPALDPIFENINPDPYMQYWSSTDYSTNDALRVSFWSGVESSFDKTSALFVRCVRGDTLPQSSFTRDNVEETVEDTATGLIWQDNAEVASETYAWQGAISNCELLITGGHDDWRLPNINELKTLADYTMSNPAIYSAFQNTANAYYWSSTTNPLILSGAWEVNFGTGFTYNSPRTDGRYVRCVRGGQ
ncbi:DUF1566 domain-containing protein [Geovibrio thiophilus]|nr:DUF1566 domain-containing protein [Geovibrio thiophilus]